MTKAALDEVEWVYRTDFKYSKAEVLLVNLCQKASTRKTYLDLSTVSYRKSDGRVGRHQWPTG